MHNRAILFIILGIFHQTSCCNKGNGGSSDPGKGVIPRLVGKDVTTSNYDSSGFNGGPVSQGSDLNCDFSSSCCWKDSSEGDVKWMTASGDSEPAKIKKNFGTSTVPSGSWLVAPAETASDGQARFVSCSVQCTTGPIKVSMKHWVTSGVTIKVCTQADGSTSLQNCQTVPSAAAGPDTVTLPAVSSLSDIVIVASGFTSKTGSVAMIDDLKVDFQSCPTTTTSTTTTSPITTTSKVCTKVLCDFENNSPCSYVDASTTGGVPGVNQKWQTVSGQFQNRATGIDKAGQGTYYSATYLYPNEAAALVNNVNFDQERVVRFMVYRATEGVDLQACCDDVNSCIYKLGSTVRVSDFRAWKSVSTTCPAGTKKVIFYAKNTGKNQGAVGLDQINLYVPSGGSPDQATQEAC